MSEQKFFRCQHCGNMVGLIHDAGVPMVCCDEPMQKLVLNATDGAVEKHIPVIDVRERLIHTKVGGVAHPMTEEHHIAFIYLQTKAGGQMKRLCVDTEAAAMFAVLDDTAISAYAYCNLHGLWVAHISPECACSGNEASADAKADDETCSAEFSEGCK